MLTYLIPVKAIATNQVCNHKKEAVTKLANSMKKTGGTIRPLVIRQIDLNSYELIDGIFQLEAAKEAGLKTIQAVVIERLDNQLEKEDNADLLEQLEIFNEAEKIEPEPVTQPTKSIKIVSTKVPAISKEIGRYFDTINTLIAENDPTIFDDLQTFLG